jgi:3-isopropylmalate dehydrogenase
VTAARFVVLPGDGIGPEVTREAVRALDAVASLFGHDFAFEEHPVGGAAMRSELAPLPQQTLDACRSADAVLLGAVGDPEFDDPDASARPEDAILGLRRELGLFANLRPIKVSAHLADAGPLKREIVEGTDILFVRELTGGVYFGEVTSGPDWVSNAMTYSRAEVERIVKIAAEAAMGRRRKLTSVDKANVLAVSRLWRAVAAEVAAEYEALEYGTVLVDAMAMHLLSRPRDFDVVVTGNLFGDILTDEASMLAGSMGVLPSASIGAGGPGLYEPIHGSAPDIAGRGIANPLAAILSAAMALRHSIGLEHEAAAIEHAADRVIGSGLLTMDLGGDATTEDVGRGVASAIGTRLDG